MVEEQWQDRPVLSRETIQEVLRNFCESVDSQYGKRNSPSTLKWVDIHMLSTALLSIQGIKIQKHEENYFIDYVMDYVELVMCFVSSFEAPEFKKQIKYVQILLNFVSVFFNETDIANTFIKKSTMKIFDLFLHGSFSNISKKELLSVFNRIASKSSKEVRVSTAEKEFFYMYKLVDSLFTHGDYAMQADVLETIFRLYGTYFQNNKITYDLLPGCNELGKALLTEISINTFDADVRSWLNKFNHDSTLIFSIPIQSLIFGNIPCKCPDEGEGRSWLDFNLIEPMVSFFTEDENIEHWNRIIILPSDVKKVEIKRKFSIDECSTTVFIEMAQPCLSYSLNAQKYMENLERNLKIIISNDEKEKITKLISHVLPRLFGTSFVHTSARISDRIKKVYKPLGLKVYKLRSANSTTSSCRSQINESPQINAFKYSALTQGANGEKMEQNFAVQSCRTASPLAQLLFNLNASNTFSSEELKYATFTPTDKKVFADNTSVIVTDFSACSSRHSVHSDVLSIDSNLPNISRLVDDSETFDDCKKSQLVPLRDQILQLERTCQSRSANDQLMSEDVFYSLTDDETEEYETAVELFEPCRATNIFRSKEPVVSDLADMLKLNETEQLTQNVPEICSKMSNSQQIQSNKSISVLDYDDNPQTDSLQIIDCLLEKEQQLELTQDLFESAIGKETVLSPQKIYEYHSDAESDIFQRPTQVFRPAERNSEALFTPLSMKVNIGIPKEQISENTFQSQSVETPLIQNSRTFIENGVEMVFIDLTSEDDHEQIEELINSESGYGLNIPENTLSCISGTKTASVEDDPIKKSGKISILRQSTQKKKAKKAKASLYVENQAFELLQDIDSQTISETDLVQRSNDQDLNVVPKPKISCASDFVENVAERNNSESKIHYVEKPTAKKTISKTDNSEITLEEKAYSGIPEETLRCEITIEPLVLLDPDKKKDVPKPKAEELEEKESPIAKPNSEKALEDNLAVSDVADVELLESALVADKPIPTMEDQTVIQALLKKKITLEDSADKANLVLGDTKSNHNSVDSAATGNSNSESKKVMEDSHPKTSLEDIDQYRENQMGVTIAKDDNLAPNTGTEVLGQEIEVNRDLSLPILHQQPTAATLWEEYMNSGSNKENKPSNALQVRTPQMNKKLDSEIPSNRKASDTLRNLQLVPKVEPIKENRTISLESSPQKKMKTKPKSKSSKKKNKTLQSFPQSDFDGVQETNVLKDKAKYTITVEKCKTKRAKKTKSELKNNAKVTIKSPKCSDKNHLETDNIEGNTASQKKASNMDKENETLDPKNYQEISKNPIISEKFVEKVRTIQTAATTFTELCITKPKNCEEIIWEDNANKKTKNANAINILNVLTVKPPQKIENISSLHKDTVGPQKGLEAEHEMAAPVKQICAEEALQNNTATVESASHMHIVEAVVHASANGRKEAPIKSSQDIDNVPEVLSTPEIKNRLKPGCDFDALKSQELTKKHKSKHNKSAKCSGTRKLYKTGSYSYLEHLDLDKSSGDDSQCTPLLNKKPKLTNSTNQEKKNKKHKSAREKTRKRTSKTNNTAWLNSTKQRDFHTLFMESRRKHVEAAYDAVQKPFKLENLNRNMWENFDIAVRNEPSNSPPGKKLLIKSDSSTPELTGSPSDHYEWPEIEIENANGKKINILQNITLKRKSPKACTTTPQKKKRLENEKYLTVGECAEKSESAKDIGWILIKQIMALVENNQLELLKRTLATSKSDAN